MKMKQLCILSTISGFALYGGVQVKPDNFDYIKSITNIFEDENISMALKNAMAETNKSIDTGLKENRSDTLKKSYMQIKNTSNNISNDLLMFSNNLSLIKTDSSVLNKFRKDAEHFSQDRDKLKQEISKLETFKKQNEKALLRSGEKKEAKAEIANQLINYAQTFVIVAQKAITDFAAIDAALFKKEKMATIRPVSRAEDMTPAKPMNDIVMPLADIDDESTDPYMVKPALKDMPKKKSSYLMEDNDAAFIKQQSQRQQSGIFKPLDTSRMSDTWNNWDSNVE